MSFDPTSIETDLRRLQPSGLDESLLARLEDCAEGTWVEPTPAELRFEQDLLKLAPAKLPAALLASLEAAAEGVPFSKDNTIVSFPHREAAHPQKNRSWWSTAAAVAILGAATALLVPTDRKEKSITSSTPEPRITSPAIVNEKLIPAGFHRGLSEASDEGVIWQNDNQPHRVLKFVYRDRLTLKDEAGHTYQADQPRVEYILVPEKTD